jgi:hypothetical protein
VRICPGCGGDKHRRAELCTTCRKRANAIGASVLTHVATPAAPMIPRTPWQNRNYHGRLREIAQLETPGIEREVLWQEERKLKKWALRRASRMFGKPFESSTELSELEMERLLEWLGDVVDLMKAGGRRPRR